MRMNKLWSLTLATAMLLPMAAMADTGLYIDGAAGQTSVDDEGINDNDTAFRAGVGYRFLENFGAELDAMSCSDFSFASISSSE